MQVLAEPGLRLTQKAPHPPTPLPGVPGRGEKTVGRYGPLLDTGGMSYSPAAGWKFNPGTAAIRSSRTYLWQLTQLSVMPT
jgi:hypothetical protein